MTSKADDRARDDGGCEAVGGTTARRRRHLGRASVVDGQEACTLIDADRSLRYIAPSKLISLHP